VGVQEGEAQPVDHHAERQHPERHPREPLRGQRQAEARHECGHEVERRGQLMELHDHEWIPVFRFGAAGAGCSGVSRGVEA